MGLFNFLFKCKHRHGFEKVDSLSCYTEAFRRTVIFKCKKCKKFCVIDRVGFFPRADILNVFFGKYHFNGNERDYKKCTEEEAEMNRFIFLKKYLKETDEILVKRLK